MISKVCILAAMALILLTAPAVNAGKHNSGAQNPPEAARSPVGGKKKLKAGPAAVGPEEVGVAYYYSGTADGSITAVKHPTSDSYTLTNTNAAFALGYPGINIPAQSPTPALFNVHAFRQMEFEYTLSPNPAIQINTTPLVTLFVHTNDGYWHTTSGVGDTTGTGPGTHLTFKYTSFQFPAWAPGVSAAEQVDQAEILFFGGSDKAANQMQVSDFKIVAQGGAGNTPSFSPNTFGTTADTAFNHQFVQAP